MTIKVLGSDGNPFDQNSIEIVAGRKLRAVYKLVLSGSYVSGGDALDLTNGGGTPSYPNGLPAAQYRGAESVEPLSRGTSATARTSVGGYYTVQAPNADAPLTQADLAALKLRVFSSGGSELAGGAYDATTLADVILLEVIYLR